MQGPGAGGKKQALWRQGSECKVVQEAGGRGNKCKSIGAGAVGARAIGAGAVGARGVGAGGVGARGVGARGVGATRTWTQLSLDNKRLIDVLHRQPSRITPRASVSTEDDIISAGGRSENIVFHVHHRSSVQCRMLG